MPENVVGISDAEQEDGDSADKAKVDDNDDGDSDATWVSSYLNKYLGANLHRSAIYEVESIQGHMFKKVWYQLDWDLRKVTKHSGCIMATRKMAGL